MKKIVSFIVCFALLVVLCPVFFTQDAEACGDCMEELREQGYEYMEIGKYELAVKGDEAILIHYYGGSRDSDELTFEHEVEGYRIVKVWDNAFETAHEKKIIIPEGVIELGGGVFEQCPNLEEVVLPSTLRVLGKAFTNCFALERVVIPEGIETISGTVFYSCDILKEVVLPSTLRRIDGLFYGCPMIETVVLPEGLESIGGAIFSNCEGVKSLEIPASVTYMAGSPIYGNNTPVNLTVSSENTYLRMENSCVYTTDGVLLHAAEGCIFPESGITAIGNHSFYGATWLESMVIPDGVTSIGICAFSSCINLKEIVIPDSVTFIDWGAFDFCKSLKEIVIPRGITSIESSTFKSCHELQKVILPEGITEIGNYAFYNCIALTEIILPKTVIKVGDYAFSLCEDLQYLYLPSEIQIGSQIVDYCTSLETVAFSGPTVPGEWQRRFELCGATVWVNVIDAEHPEDGTRLTANDVGEDDPNEDASDEAPAENSREESAEQPEEESEDTVSVPAVSEEESVSASRSESSSPRTIPEEDAEENAFPWGWIVAAVFIIGAGTAIVFIRKKK